MSCGKTQEHTDYRLQMSFQSLLTESLSQYITSHPGQLSLAIPPWVDTMSTRQRAVMPCGWGVKAGVVHEWVTGKTVWSPCYHGPYLSTLAMGSSHDRALYKCPITLLYFTSKQHKSYTRLIRKRQLTDVPDIIGAVVFSNWDYYTQPQAEQIDLN